MATLCIVALSIVGLLIAVGIVTILFNPTAHWYRDV